MAKVSKWVSHFNKNEILIKDLKHICHQQIKCVEYWPMMGSNSYGDITITYINSHDWPEYKVTHLILEKV